MSVGIVFIYLLLQQQKKNRIRGPKPKRRIILACLFFLFHCNFLLENGPCKSVPSKECHFSSMFLDRYFLTATVGFILPSEEYLNQLEPILNLAKESRFFSNSFSCDRPFVERTEPRRSLFLVDCNFSYLNRLTTDVKKKTQCKVFSRLSTYTLAYKCIVYN